MGRAGGGRFRWTSTATVAQLLTASDTQDRHITEKVPSLSFRRRQNIPVDGRFKEITTGLITRLTSKTPAMEAPSAAECRFYPISGLCCPERREE